MKFLPLFLILLIFTYSDMNCGEIPENPNYKDFFWDPVKAHIAKYGDGIKMPGIWNAGKINQQLRKKPRRRYKK